MGFKETIHCDECGAQKKDANHWYVGCQSQLGVTFDTYEHARRDEALLKVMFLYCGQSCTDKAFQRWKDTGQIEKQDTVAIDDAAELVTAD